MICVMAHLTIAEFATIFNVFSYDAVLSRDSNLSPMIAGLMLPHKNYVQGAMGYWTVNYAGPQSFIIH